MDNNEMNDTGAKKERWYQTTWFMWVMLVLFFPVGLFLMWKYKKHNLNARLIITTFFVLLMLVQFLHLFLHLVLPLVLLLSLLLLLALPVL